MKEADLEWQWQQYLRRAGVSENEMSPVQKQETRRAFYGACGQMLIFLRDELTTLSDEEGAKLYQNLLSQVMNFWTAQVNRQN